METFFKLSFLVLYGKKNKFLKTKLVYPFKLIKLSPKEKKGAAIVYTSLNAINEQQYHVVRMGLG